MSSFPPPKLQDKLAVVDIQENHLSRVALWRSCLIISCALGLGLLATLPYWQIKHQSQISFVGKKLVSQDSIYNALGFTYPQLIWTINGSNLAQKVQSIPAIEVARIDKQIAPPQLIIHLQERVPVAIATSLGQVGFLDIHGEWIPQDLYANFNDGFTLPKLTVLNYQPQYKQSWISIYQLISFYPELKVNEVQWNHSNSLFIQTKIGRVFLGADLSRLEQQFKIISKLQKLPEHIERRKIAYIDLSNPNIDLIQKY